MKRIINLIIFISLQTFGFSSKNNLKPFPELPLLFKNAEKINQFTTRIPFKLVDGKWIEDPKNPNKTLNEFNQYNSFIDIKKEVTFLLEDFKDAKEVFLAGSFNNWSETDYVMTKTKKGWIFKTKLSGGKYHYKFIVDGKWKLDPNNPIKEYDWDGHINSVKMVK